MAGISISGLVSNSFDWQSIVTQLIAIDSVPITRLQNEESDNIDRLAVFASLKTKLTDLQTAAQALKADGLFTGRTATASGSGWTVSADDAATTGSYTIAVSQLATQARLNGDSGIASPLNAAATDYDPDTNPNGVDGLTLASLPISTAITAGNFSINGHQVTIATTDSLQDVFDKINAADPSVTASYNRSTDKLTLTSASPIILGAANDTSNFLSAMRLANNGTGSISSTSSLGSLSKTATLDNARLGTTLSASSGSFTVNGVSIAYDSTTDSLNTLLSRINASSAGVTASYDSAKDRVVLVNNTTGDTGVGVADVTGNLATALGLTSGAGATLSRGQNAQFTINGGDTLTSESNTIGDDYLGTTGVSVTLTSATSQTVTVAADTASMQTAIQTFITKFNAVQSFIDTNTKITTGADGKVTTSTLSGNHEVQNWASELRSMAFSQVTGLTGSITRLSSLGLDFSSTDSTLSIKDSAKLTAALTSNPDDVAAFFGTSSTGFAAKFDTYLTKKLDSKEGGVQLQMNTLNKANTDIEAQIAVLNTRLAAEKERLTNAFIAMDNAKQTASTQQSTLDAYFKSSSSSSS